MEAAEAPLSTCRVLTDTWIPPVRDTTAGSARTFDKCCFHSNSMHVIHTNQITCGVLWRQNITLCNWNERPEDPVGVVLLQKPYTAHRCMTNQIFVICACLICLGVLRRLECARVYKPERARVAWGKLTNACAGSAGCPLANIIQPLSNLPACDMCTCTESTCQLQLASN